jgi:hypothetical protein
LNIQQSDSPVNKGNRKKGKHFVLQIQKTANDPSTVSVISNHFFSWNPYQVMSYVAVILDLKKTMHGTFLTSSIPTGLEHKYFESFIITMIIASSMALVSKNILISCFK